MDSHYFMTYAQLQALINLLLQQGYNCIGPKTQDGAIVYGAVSNITEFPWGVSVEQNPASYRLTAHTKQRAFQWSNGPAALKPLLFKPRETAWRAERDSQGKLQFTPFLPKEKPLAVFGVRSCDLAAMRIQDKVFLEGASINQQYQERRQALFIIAVNCTTSANTCFCLSAGYSPKASEAFDLALTEIELGFTVVAGSKQGKKILTQLHLLPATESQHQEALVGEAQAITEQKKKIPLDNKRPLRDLLFANLNHPRWEEVATRCLSCGNCTAVCPTCFCYSSSEVSALDGSYSEHQQEWDSCFSAGHSLLGGKPLRASTRERYRQWLTHKVGSWFDQFDSSGCVGCGRCISWCPVGIDLTEELAAIVESSGAKE